MSERRERKGKTLKYEDGDEPRLKGAGGGPIHDPGVNEHVQQAAPVVPVHENYDEEDPKILGLE